MKLNIPKHLEKHLTPEEKEISKNCPYSPEEVIEIMNYLKPLSENAAKTFLASSILALSSLDGSNPVEVACRFVNLADIAEKEVRQKEQA